MNIAIIIPCLNPDEKLIKYVDDLIELGFNKIILINDGSSKKHLKYFTELKKYNECILLNHDKNKGKGAALKTGFNFYLNNLKNYSGVVTADSDGQHSPKDTYKIASKLSNENIVVLGSRSFNNKKIPLRSKFGNNLTSKIFKLKYKTLINDTQTGLRGFPNVVIEKIINLEGEKFEYEINVLIYIVTNNIKLTDVPIDTIYIEKNKSSHFKPIKDSIKIYKAILKKR